MSDAGKEPGDTGGVGDVASDADQLLAGPQRGGEGFLSLRYVGCRAGAEDHVGALGEEGLDDDAAQALAAAGDECVASGKFHGQEIRCSEFRLGVIGWFEL